MRDVTDNVTGELAGLEQKRGRGRPSTGHAKSNAERQAAYRARRQAERATDRSVAVTKKPADVDAYDDCRIEVERLQELLAESRAATERATRTLQSVMHQNSWVAAGERADQEELEEVRRELEAKQGQVGMLIDYQQELDGQLRATRLQVELAEAERNKAFDENRHLKEQIADAKKSVTPSNGNFVPAQEYQRLQLDVASLRRDNEYLEGEVTRLSGVNSALRAVDKKSVTRKAVTKTSSNAKSSSGLFAEIKRSSKYYGQSNRGDLFPVSVLVGGEYVVQGGPGGQYRLKDVWLWAVDAEDPAKRVRLG